MPFDFTPPDGIEIQGECPKCQSALYGPICWTCRNEKTDPQIEASMKELNQTNKKIKEDREAEILRKELAREKRELG